MSSQPLIRRALYGGTGSVTVLAEQMEEAESGAPRAIKSGDVAALDALFDTDVNLANYRGPAGESLLHLAHLYHPKDAPNELARLILRRAPHLIDSVYEGDVYLGENVSMMT